MSAYDYAELHCLSNFTFLRGASHPEELVSHALALGYRALAITDECSLSGVVRAHLVAKQCGLHLIIGSEFCLSDGLCFVLLATDRRSYGAISSLISQARRAAAKGAYHLTREDLQSWDPHNSLALWFPGAQASPDDGRWFSERFPQRAWIAAELFAGADDRQRLAQLNALGQDCALRLVASGDVHMHCRERRALQDTLTAIRLGKPLQEMGLALYANAERHLRPRPMLSEIYPPALLSATVEIARRCTFSLDELRYEYPQELVPDEHTSASWLRCLTEQGMRSRWPEGTPGHVCSLVEKELALIGELNYEPFFLTVHDIVRFARSQAILCQGRGSAANSAVCYCLGITEVDPARMELLFERFISKERNEPPDIDVDFEHERREEVIQYIYKKYGRGRAALAATVVTYKARSAVRDVGKALGMSGEQVERLAKSLQWWDGQKLNKGRLQAIGFSPDNPRIKRLSALVAQLMGFPRHLSQHVGGFVISQGPLSELVPTENAAMADRTVIQWEKDDLEALGLLKVDVLSLGMLTAIRKALTLIEGYSGRRYRLADIPAEDPEVYAMIHKADTIGVFQIESRAQMSMLPRLKPRNYYDLVIQIAIVRPGPIQGNMIHPYLARRAGREPITYPSKAVEQVLKRTLGIPIFQEQVMQLAVVAAGFTPGEADQLRRSMAAWKRKGGLEPFEKRLREGMLARGYSEDFAKRIFDQIKGFGEYGFPESHSASFALLAYASSWLKCHEPAAFTCALLNSQPMGFYAPAQLVQDVQRHGVNVHPVSVLCSDWDCALEPRKKAKPDLRLGLRMVKSLSKSGAERIITARRHSPFSDPQDLAYRACLDQKDLDALAVANALVDLSGHRHQAGWDVAGIERPLPLMSQPRFHETAPILRRPTEQEDTLNDYASIGLTLGKHPLAILRRRFKKLGVRQAEQLWGMPHGAFAKVAGLVIGRQRPLNAKGVLFMTLEDETGLINLVIWPDYVAAQRRVILTAQLMKVIGTVQQQDGVLHLVVGRMEDYSAWLSGLRSKSRDFC